MLDALDSDRLQALGNDPAAQYARTIIAQFGVKIEHQRAELQFQSTKIAALSFELARLKQWRFGQSSEALDTQGQLFDAKTQALLQADEQAEDRAAEHERTAPGKRRPKRQPLPGQLERIEHRDEIESGLCPQGHPLSRIGEEISEQLGCEPTRFFVHPPAHPRQVRLCAWPDRGGRRDAGENHRQGHPSSRPAGAGGAGQARR